MSDEMQPNPDDFSFVERPREYEVEFRVVGTVTMKVEADSKKNAERVAWEEIQDDDEFGIELDDVHAVDVELVCKTPKMYRVFHEGRAMQVSRLRPGMTPREPDERGF